MKTEKSNLLKRVFIEVAIGIMLIMAMIVWQIQIAKAWTGDPSSPHVLMGSQLIKHSLFNRIAK